MFPEKCQYTYYYHQINICTYASRNFKRKKNVHLCYVLSLLLFEFSEIYPQPNAAEVYFQIFHIFGIKKRVNPHIVFL